MVDTSLLLSSLISLEVTHGFVAKAIGAIRGSLFEPLLSFTTRNIHEMQVSSLT